QAIDKLTAQNKRVTLAAVHAVLDHRGSMTTLIKLKAEIDALGQSDVDSSEALAAFRQVWHLARNAEYKQRETQLAELRENITMIGLENERLKGVAAGGEARLNQLGEEKRALEQELRRIVSNAEATAYSMREATASAGKALRELADLRAAHAAELTGIRSELAATEQRAHDFELRLTRANALLEAKRAH